MAPSAALFLLLIFLFSSLNIHARESQFFSTVSTHEQEVSHEQTNEQKSSSIEDTTANNYHKTGRGGYNGVNEHSSGHSYNPSSMAENNDNNNNYKKNGRGGYNGVNENSYGQNDNPNSMEGNNNNYQKNGRGAYNGVNENSFGHN